MKSQIGIRNYLPDYYEQVKQLLINGGLYYEPMDSFERLQEKVSRDPNSILVALELDRVVGTVSLMEDGRIGFIFRLAVDPESRNRGIGRALMEEAEKELFRRGHQEINILVEETDPELQGYYERQGYEKGTAYRWMSKERM